MKAGKKEKEEEEEEESEREKVTKGGLLHYDNIQVSERSKGKARDRKRKKTVSYFNIVVFSRSVRMPTTTASMYVLSLILPPSHRLTLKIE